MICKINSVEDIFGYIVRNETPGILAYRYWRKESRIVAKRFPGCGRIFVLRNRWKRGKKEKKRMRRDEKKSMPKL